MSDVLVDTDNLKDRGRNLQNQGSALLCILLLQVSTAAMSSDSTINRTSPFEEASYLCTPQAGDLSGRCLPWCK